MAVWKITAILLLFSAITVDCNGMKWERGSRDRRLNGFAFVSKTTHRAHQEMTWTCRKVKGPVEQEPLPSSSSSSSSRHPSVTELTTVCTSTFIQLSHALVRDARHKSVVLLCVRRRHQVHGRRWACSRRRIRRGSIKSPSNYTFYSDGLGRKKTKNDKIEKPKGKKKKENCQQSKDIETDDGHRCGRELVSRQSLVYLLTLLLFTFPFFFLFFWSSGEIDRQTDRPRKEYAR